MGEDENDKRKVEPFHNRNEISHHKVMETASLPFKQQSPLGTSLLGSESKKISGNLSNVTSAFVYVFINVAQFMTILYERIFKFQNITTVLS